MPQADASHAPSVPDAHIALGPGGGVTPHSGINAKREVAVVLNLCHVALPTSPGCSPPGAFHGSPPFNDITAGASGCPSVVQPRPQCQCPAISPQQQTIGGVTWQRAIAGDSGEFVVYSFVWTRLSWDGSKVD